MTDHPDFEALSAVLDGEPEDSHVAACAVCRGRLAELRLARDAVAQPVPPAAAEVRERAIARALAAAEPAAPAPDPVVSPIRAPAPDPTGRRWWLGGSAAAVLVVVVGAMALLGTLGGSSSDETASVGAGADATAESATGFAANDAVVDAGDLGDVASVEALRAKAATARATTTFGPSAGPAAAEAPPAGGNTLADTAVPAPRQVGTRVCEVEARTARPSLGAVVYAANLRFQGTPAVALGFAATPSAPPETLLVLAPQQGCRILAETTP